MSFIALLLVVSYIAMFYQAYKYLWLHIIRLFESVNTVTKMSSTTASGTTTPLLLRTQSSQFLKLVVSNEDCSSKLVHCAKVLSRVLFSMTMATTVTIVEFILSQITNTEPLGPLVYSVWNFEIYSLVFILVFAQPLIITILIVNKFFKARVLNKMRIKIGAVVGVLAAWLIFILKFDSFTDFKDLDFQFDSLRSNLLQKVSIIGITLISILNGVGSFSQFYYYLYKDPKFIIQDEDYAKQKLLELKSTYDRTENLINSKTQELASHSEVLNKRTNIQPKGSFMDLKTLNPFKPSLDPLEIEIESLVKIKNELLLKVLKIERSLQEANYKSTKKDKIFSMLSKSLAVYCIFKIIQVTIVKLISFYYHITSNDDSPRSKESDPLVITITKIMKMFIDFQDEDALVNQLNFIVSGGLFIASFNGVFITLTHLYRFLPIDLSVLQQSTTTNVTKKSVSIIKNLIVSELTGIYCLATLYILKSNLTRNFSSTLTSLLTHTKRDDQGAVIMINNALEIQVIDNWFEKVFLISVVITAGCIKLSETLGGDEGFESQDLLNKIV